MASERIPTHTKAELNDVAVKAQQGDETAKETLMVMMRPYVVNRVRQFDRLGEYSREQQDEIKQAAWVGVWAAVEKFDPDQDVKFSTLAWWWMRHEMQVWMGHNSRALPLSLRAWKTAKRLEEAWDDLNPDRDIYSATEEELMELGIDLPTNIDPRGRIVERATRGRELLLARQSSFEIDPDFDAQGSQSAEDDYLDAAVNLDEAALSAYITVEGLMTEGDLDAAESAAITFVDDNGLDMEVAENMLSAARLRMGL